MGMSKMALDRCRKLVITDESDDDSYRMKMEVFDPKTPHRAVFRYTARTLHDYTRVKRSVQGKFRIPEETVTYPSSGEKALLEGESGEEEILSGQEGDTVIDTAKDIYSDTEPTDDDSIIE